MISSKQFDLIRKRKAAEDCVNKQAERLKGGGGPLIFSVHCGTFKHVGGHKLLYACTFFFS